MQRTPCGREADGAGCVSDRVRGAVLVGAHEVGTSVDVVSRGDCLLVIHCILV